MTTLKYDYTAMRARFVSAEPEMTITAVAEEFGVVPTAISTITRRAKSEGWHDLREKRIQRVDQKLVDGMADREAKRRLRRMAVEDNALEAIDEAISKMRSDMKRTKWEKNPATQEYELVPAVTYRPEQVVQLMDRIKGLFDGTAPAGDSTTNLTQVNFGDFDPSREDHRALAAQIVEHTRGAGGPSRRSAGSSPLPDAPGTVEDEWP